MSINISSLLLAFLLILARSLPAEELALYCSPRSSSSLRISLALAYKEIPFKEMIVRSEDLQSTDYQMKNPQRKIPVLVVDDYPLSQSIAILEYLEETYTGKPLMPNSPLLRAQVRRFAQIIVSDIQPLQNLALLDHLPENHRLPWAQRWITKGVAALEALVQEGGGVYCCGDEVTYADLCLLPQLRNARLFEVNLEEFPHLLEIEQRLLQIKVLADVMESAEQEGCS